MGKIPILTKIFQRGWNHQLEKHNYKVQANTTIFLTVSEAKTAVKLPELKKPGSPEELETGDENWQDGMDLVYVWSNGK